MKADFFASVRAAFGKLSQQQVEGIEALLSATIGLPIEERAYLLATAWHETARTMQPITERGQRDYFDKYEPGTRLGQTLGNITVGDGYRYRGRGYVQITGRANYARAARFLGHDLVHAPDLALQPHIAAQILVQGCRSGWFTGKRLRDYLPGDYVGARRVVNGTDRADLIAGHARAFEAALNRLDDATPAPQSPWAALVAFVSSIFTRKGA